MLENLIFLSAPIAACILFAGILSYFGNHILSRGIIFIDIAIAQIAALGTMIGLLLGFAEESFSIEIASYLFTLVVISAFALTKFKKQRISQEAIIGIIYCIGLAMALLLAEKIPGGSNYISKTITGNILWVSWTEVFYCLLLFLGIAAIHLYFRKAFVKISDYATKEELAYPLKRLRMFELVFYITFGVVIVKTVPIAGIFLVFILLVAPTAAISLFTNNWKKRFIGSWIIGFLGSVIGIYLSYSFNISNGPTIVCLLGILVFVLAFIKLLKKS